jgi:osmoprotectant transport system ATP-binding protein
MAELLKSNSGPVIEFRDVSYRLPDGRAILSNISLQVRSGEVMVLLGRSGGGKTSALKLINRLHRETAWEVIVEGVPTKAWDVIALRRRMGYVVQELGLFPHQSVEKNVGLIPRLEKWAEDKTNHRIDEMLRLVDLEPREFRSRYPHQLSGGQRQRVAVARALAGDPPILLMDEPFGALDPLSRADLQLEFRHLQQKLRKTVVLVTHDLAEALMLGNTIAFFEAGRLVGVYSAGELLRSAEPAAAKYVAAFRTGHDAFASYLSSGR